MQHFSIWTAEYNFKTYGNYFNNLYIYIHTIFATYEKQIAFLIICCWVFTLNLQQIRFPGPIFSKFSLIYTHRVFISIHYKHFSPSPSLANTLLMYGCSPFCITCLWQVPISINAFDIYYIDMDFKLSMVLLFFLFNIFFISFNSMHSEVPMSWCPR